MSTALTVVMCDDSEPDCQLMAIAWEQLGLAATLKTVLSGDELFRYLQSGEPAHLILLDMNLPRVPGLQILTRLKDDPTTCHIPVIMFTSSDWDKEVRKGYALGASGFVTKPAELQDLLATLRAVDAFWLKTAMLPR